MENANLPMLRKIVEGGEGTYEVWEPIPDFRKEDDLTDQQVDEAIQRIMKRKRG